MTPGVPYAEVIGDPISHSKSPLIHKFWLKKLGMEGDYRALQVRLDELADYFAERSRDPLWRGCNITMPLKLAALAHVIKPHDPSFPPEPVNLAVPKDDRVHGFNTDIHGLLEPLTALDPKRFDLSGRTQRDLPLTAVVLGSGGVLYSVAWVLMSLGYNPIVLVARSRDKVDAFLGKADRRQFGVLPWGAALPPCDLLVNATPLGMEGQRALPYNASSVRAGGIVFEMLYHPLETLLLADARARGLRCVDGLQMLLGQAAPSFGILFGTPPPREHDVELRGLLTA